MGFFHVFVLKVIMVMSGFQLLTNASLKDVLLMT